MDQRFRSRQVERGTEMADIFLARLEPHMAENAFIAGADVSIADITCWFVINMVKMLGVDVEGRYPNIHRWHTEFTARPSTDT